MSFERGDLDAAERHYRGTRALVDTMKPGTPAILNADVLGARIALARGRADEAAATFERLQAVYDQQPPNPGSASIRVMLADAALALGQPAEALKWVDDGLPRLRALQSGMPHPRPVGSAHFVRARAQQAAGDVAGARQSAAEALTHLLATIDETHPAIGRLRAWQSSVAAS